jgi:ParB family chromosome partitioning protein
MTPPKLKGLGRGLDALLAANNAPENQRQDSLPVGSLQPGKYQPRTRMTPVRSRNWRRRSRRRA